MLWLFGQLGLSWAVEMKDWPDVLDMLVQHGIICRLLEGAGDSARRYGNMRECRRMVHKSCVHATWLVSVLSGRL